MYIIENDGTVTTERDIRGFDFDPNAGTGANLVATIDVVRRVPATDVMTGDISWHTVRNFTLVA